MLKLKAESLNWAIDHALNYGDTGSLPLPFEYQAIEGSRDAMVDYLKSVDILEWKLRPSRVLLAP
jgi:hypothetical protein